MSAAGLLHFLRKDRAGKWGGVRTSLRMKDVSKGTEGGHPRSLGRWRGRVSTVCPGEETRVKRF